MIVFNQFSLIGTKGTAPTMAQASYSTKPEQSIKSDTTWTSRATTPTFGSPMTNLSTHILHKKTQVALFKSNSKLPPPVPSRQNSLGSNDAGQNGSRQFTSGFQTTDHSSSVATKKVLDTLQLPDGLHSCSIQLEYCNMLSPKQEDSSQHNSQGIDNIPVHPFHQEEQQIEHYRPQLDCPIMDSLENLVQASSKRISNLKYKQTICTSRADDAFRYVVADLGRDTHSMPNFSKYQFLLRMKPTQKQHLL